MGIGRERCERMRAAVFIIPRQVDSSVHHKCRSYDVRSVQTEYFSTARTERYESYSSNSGL